MDVWKQTSQGGSNENAKRNGELSDGAKRSLIGGGKRKD